MEMSRLADYFVVAGYDHDKDSAPGSQDGLGKIIQRFPEQDWEDVPFHPGIELFCQPGGWRLYKSKLDTTFHISVLTDIEASRHYCAVLSFFESVSVPAVKPTDDWEEEVENTSAKFVTMFAPKCLVLVSRLDHFDTLKNCLCLIYTVHIDAYDRPLETLVGNILGHVQVPPPGGPQVLFSIGADDRQALQPPLHESIPATRSTVASLVRHIGIQNFICLFSACLTEQKILIHSASYNRLTDSCGALLSLLYPLKYSYVYIPVLPAYLTEVLNTPTPFIMGIHSSLKQEITELVDLIVADLDGGCISIPECVNLLLPSDHIFERVQEELTMVLSQDLKLADLAFPVQSKTPPKPEFQDKEIRAIFLRLQAELLVCYRSCLTFIRIHPSPVITFNKGKFLFGRGLVGDEFLSRVLDGMSFGTFVGERGPPYRVCDLFDKIVASIEDILINEKRCSPDKALKNIRELAEQLFHNENPSKSQYLQKIPQPSEDSINKIQSKSFPWLEPAKITDVIEDGMAKALVQSMNPRIAKLRAPKSQIVPIGPSPGNLEEQMNLINNSARRLEVLRTCISFIFENKILDAKRLFAAVLRSLKSRIARQALTQELTRQVEEKRAVLQSQQFDMVVRLMNCALQEERTTEEFSLVMSILPLVTSFCRKLCPGTIQFAYSCTQDHPVWASMHFWETAFYADVELNIKGLYLPESTTDKTEAFNEAFTTSSDSLSSSNTSTNGIIIPEEKSALEIAAEQLRMWPHLSRDVREEYEQNEEGIVYSQAVHYANRMVCLRVPLDVSKGLKNSITMEGDSGGSSNRTESIGGSDSYDAENAYDEANDVGTAVIKFISRFIDKVCTEAGVTQDHLKSLHTMIPGLVAMHIETLEAVNRESKRLPPLKKPKILKPILLPGEELFFEGLRGYLLPDGREDGQGGVLGGPALLPAEGAIFLTTYRIIFKGTPIDMQACEQVVTRSFPISALLKEKKINVSNQCNALHLEQFSPEGLQLRSVTFQLIKIAFDEEVNVEKIENFRKSAVKLRYPQSVFHTFAFHGANISTALSAQMKHKEKSTTLRKIAKSSKTFLRTGKRPTSSTSKGKLPPRHNKYIIPGLQNTSPSNRHSVISVGNESVSSEIDSRPNSMMIDDDELAIDREIDRTLQRLNRIPPVAVYPSLSVIEEADGGTLKPRDTLTTEKVAERSFVKDYLRLGLCNLPEATLSRPKTCDPFRISEVNLHFSVVRSYPPLVVVPGALSDDSIRRLAKCHRSNRFPAICWRHQGNKSLLIRSSGFHGRGVMGMIKSSQNTTSGASESSTSKSIEQDKYFSTVVLNTPNCSYRKSDSLVSLNSILPPTTTIEIPDGTPVMGSRRPHPNSGTMFNRGFLRSSGGKSYQGFKSSAFASKMGSLRATVVGQRQRPQFGKYLDPNQGAFPRGLKTATLDNRSSSSSSLNPATHGRNGSITEQDLAIPKAHDPQKAALYIFGEKSQIRACKTDPYNKWDFIPYEFQETRHVKASFKKVMKACVPSATHEDPEMGFRKLMEDSEWLQQIQSIMQLAGAVVDLMDIQGSSVMVSFEEGWDFTAQVVSLAQLLMDPHYRTIEGFRVLIEKEWLAFGHRFSHRSNHTVTHQASGFAPVFLQFLDCVFQVQEQFPMSFEFNKYYLEMMAYHQVSNRFQTFMLDSEYERFEAATNVLERRPSRAMDSGDSDSEQPRIPVRSFWDYVDKMHTKSQVFFNLEYTPHPAILRPYTNLSKLKIWDYYYASNLAGGPSFDRELFEKSIVEDNETPLTPADRRSINACYDSIMQTEPDMQRWLLEEVRVLEAELERKARDWRKVLLDYEKFFAAKRRHLSMELEEARAQGNAAHRKTTMDILFKGKNAGEIQPKGITSHHHFEPHNFITPTNCDYCKLVLYGVVKQGIKAKKCQDCGYNVHDTCIPHVPKECRRQGSTREMSTTQPSKQMSSQGTQAETQPNNTTTSGMDYEQFHANIAETRSFEGYLQKRGARLKAWKSRWFVLDSQKHQLRYYENDTDMIMKGYIDLKEVEYVQPAFAIPGAPKKSEDNVYFDMKTTKRTYNFAAENKVKSEEWISNIQDCLS